MPNAYNPLTTSEKRPILIVSKFNILKALGILLSVLQILYTVKNQVVGFLTGPMCFLDVFFTGAICTPLNVR